MRLSGKPGRLTDKSCGLGTKAGTAGSIIQIVSEDLGVQCGAGTVYAELDKLLVYEEGAFFAPHKEYVGDKAPHSRRLLTFPYSKEKAKNMFGTLVVCLPSEHVGGGVRLTHGKEERVLETDNCSSYGVSYLAW
jgi:hypothetical protein